MVLVGGQHVLGMLRITGGASLRLVPVGGVGHDPVPKDPVLLPGGGQHRQEPAATAVDVGHVVERGELGVRRVEEVGAAGQGDQGVPGVDVGGHVRGVPIGDTEGDRHGPVSGHRQDPHQLLEVRPMVLAEPVAGGRGGFAATLPSVGGAIRTRELQGRGVVVQPGQVDVEVVHRIQDQPGQQAGPVRVEQPREHPPDPVIVQQVNICWRQADH